MTEAEKHIQLDWPWIQRWLTELRSASSFYGVPVEVLAAMMSRESGGGRLLKPQGPAGTGDQGHGRGLMQIDDRWHEFARTGDWRNPLSNIKYGAQLLANNLAAARKKVSVKDALRVAVAGYNCGLGNALAAYQAAGIAGVDARTAGGNYSRDVFNRAAVLAPYLGAPKKKLCSGF